jgi:hypothetical protein
MKHLTLAVLATVGLFAMTATAAATRSTRP